MHDNAESRWWQNRANRYAEQVENLQAEVAFQTAITDRVREYAEACLDRKHGYEEAVVIIGSDLLGIVNGVSNA